MLRPFAVRPRLFSILIGAEVDLNGPVVTRSVNERQDHRGAPGPVDLIRLGTTDVITANANLSPGLAAGKHGPQPPRSPTLIRNSSSFCAQSGPASRRDHGHNAVPIVVR